MATFDYSFDVKATVKAVSRFHKDTRVLKKLTPPPIFAQIHDFEPLAEGSKADFTLWFGPIPVRWQALHRDVSQYGFTDIQVQGPLKSWKHRHSFTPVNDYVTHIKEHIEYEHHRGLRGLGSRLLFSRPGLIMLFTARKLITRRALKQAPVKGVADGG